MVGLLELLLQLGRHARALRALEHRHRLLPLRLGGRLARGLELRLGRREACLHRAERVAHLRRLPASHAAISAACDRRTSANRSSAPCACCCSSSCGGGGGRLRRCCDEDCGVRSLGGGARGGGASEPAGLWRPACGASFSAAGGIPAARRNRLPLARRFGDAAGE